MAIDVDSFDGVVDLGTGVIDVRLGGPASEVRDQEADRRRLAARLLGAPGSDPGAVDAVTRAIFETAEDGRLLSSDGARAILAALDRYLSGGQET